MKKVIYVLLTVLLICYFLFILHDSIFYEQIGSGQYDYYRFYLMSPEVCILLLYLAYILISKKINRLKIKFDKKDLGYCRDNLDKMCPGSISYLKNFKIEPEKDVAAHMLKLLYQGYLKEENGTLKKSNIDTKKLSYADLEILRLIDNEYFSYPDYEKYIALELIENGLIELKKSNLLKSNKRYKRTAKGKELLNHIYGLKNFLYDFGNLEEKSYKDVYTRDYYLIYAVVLGINEVIPSEIMQMVNNKEEK